jgi:MFS family permease
MTNETSVLISPTVTGRRGLQLSLLTIAAAAAMYARTAISPLQETMRTAFALSDNDMALLQGPALALPLIIAAIPLGLLIDRQSRARLLVLFTLMSFVGSLFTALAPNFSLLFAARCLVGLASTATGTAAFSLLGDLYEPAQRGRATLAVAIGQFAGSATAFALCGELLAMLGPAPNGWQWVMLLSSAPLGLIVLSMFAMREPSRTGTTIQSPSVREAFSEFWSYRAVILPLLTGLVTVEIGFQSALVWTAPALVRHFGMGSGQLGAIMATGLMVSGVLGPVVGGVLADILQRSGGPRLTMGVLSAIALLTAPAALFSLTPGIAYASVLLVTFMTTISALLVMGTALFTIVLPNELRGLGMSVFASATLVTGVGLGPVGVSLLSSVMGGSAMIGEALAAVGAAAGILAASLFIFGRSHFPRGRRSSRQ